jgi:hypothetical protein
MPVVMHMLGTMIRVALFHPAESATWRVPRDAAKRGSDAARASEYATQPSRAHGEDGKLPDKPRARRGAATGKWVIAGLR